MDEIITKGTCHVFFKEHGEVVREVNFDAFTSEVMRGVYLINDFNIDIWKDEDIFILFFVFV
jgi:hypothetical protein